MIVEIHFPDDEEVKIIEAMMKKIKEEAGKQHIHFVIFY